MMLETNLPATFTFTIDPPYFFYIHLKRYNPHIGPGLCRFPVAIMAEPSVAEWQLSSVVILLEADHVIADYAALRLVNFN